MCTYSCSATHSSSLIIKFVDDMMIVGLSSDEDEAANREEVSTLSHRWQEHTLSLSVKQTKELIVGFRKPEKVHTPIIISGAVEKVSIHHTGPRLV